MGIDKQSRSNRLWAVVIGIGLALSPIHNSWLTGLVTNNGEVGFFLPAFGTAIWLMGSLAFVVNNWEKLDWGDKRMYVPLFIIVLSMGVSGFLNADTLKDKIAPFLMGVSLLAVYVVGRNLGVMLFRVLIPFVIVGAMVAIAIGLVNPGQPTGGLITNYLASAGFLIFGAVVNQGKWQWTLLAVMLIGLFFIGALEAVFIVGVMGIVVIVRRDFSRRFVIITGAMALLIGIWILFDYLAPLYEGNHNLNVLFTLISGKATLTQDTLDLLTTGRWGIIVDAMRHIKVFGHGYSLSTVGGGIVHNIPLIIVHQIGPLAAIAWTVITVYCLIKTKWKYAWIAVIAMGVFDHYIWTQFVPYFWVLVGVSTTSTITSDKIFRTK